MPGKQHRRCKLCPRYAECRFGCEMLDRWETSGEMKRARFLYR